MSFSESNKKLIKANLWANLKFNFGDLSINEFLQKKFPLLLFID